MGQFSEDLLQWFVRVTCEAIFNCFFVSGISVYWQCDYCLWEVSHGQTLIRSLTLCMKSWQNIMGVGMFVKIAFIAIRRVIRVSKS